MQRSCIVDVPSMEGLGICVRHHVSEGQGQQWQPAAPKLERTWKNRTAPKPPNSALSDLAIEARREGRDFLEVPMANFGNIVDYWRPCFSSLLRIVICM